MAALLWLLDPLVLGLGHLDGVDMPFALTAVLVSLALVSYLRRSDRASLLWLGVACGAAVSAQSTGLLLAAIALVVVFVSARGSDGKGRAPWRQVGLLVLVAWVVVWIPYIVLDPAVVVHSWVVLPQPYVEGLRYLATHDTAAAPGFLLGAQWTGANPWFWPATLLVKLSLPILVLLLGNAVLIGLVRG